MITAMIVLASMSVGACVGLVVAGLCAIQKEPAVSTVPPVGFGGPRGRLDPLPIPGSSRALASPLAEFGPPNLDARGVQASGRGHHLDRYCADDVAVTITNDRIWVDVDGTDSVRIYRIKRLSIDDRRAT